jgi:hypothetical protein
LSSSIDLRRSADLPIAPFFVSIVYVREWESKTHTRKKSLEIRGFSQATGRQSDKPSRRNCQLMALSEDDGSEGQLEDSVCRKGRTQIVINSRKDTINRKRL